MLVCDRERLQPIVHGVGDGHLRVGDRAVGTHGVFAKPLECLTFMVRRKGSHLADLLACDGVVADRGAGAPPPVGQLPDRFRCIAGHRVPPPRMRWTVDLGTPVLAAMVRTDWPRE